MSLLIEHEGTVSEVKPDSYVVQIVQQSACVSCEVKGHCSASESKAKLIEVRKEPQVELKVGDLVCLVGERSLGLKAVWIAFVIPMIAIVLLLSVSAVLGMSDGVASLVVLLFLILYYVLLYSQRERLKSTFRFRIRRE